MLFYNILTVPRLQHSDRGAYTCHVSSGENAKREQVNVTVYGEESLAEGGEGGGYCGLLTLKLLRFHPDGPFIRLKPRSGSVIQAQAGQKAFRISPKLRAFPPPEVTW